MFYVHHSLLATLCCQVNAFHLSLLEVDVFTFYFVTQCLGFIQDVATFNNVDVIYLRFNEFDETIS